MPYYRSGTQKPLEAGNGIDITNETISLKQMSTSQFGGAKIDGTSITVNSNRQIKKLKTQTVTLSANTSEITAGSTDVITATASAGGTLSVSSSDSSVATASVSNGEVTITGVGEGNCVITVIASAIGDYGVGTATIDTTVTVVSIYGAEWDGSSSPVWTRTDDAVGFVDPNPSVGGSTGSSPFDNIMPWAGMQIVEDASAGTLVEIPKFYYKWTRNGSAMKLQICMEQKEGFLCSPAHSDRDDGVGERDYVYVGRYLCSGENESFKSITGKIRKDSTGFSDFCNGIHNLGSNVWMYDFATYWTVCMLYLVEYANWNSQAMIGYGNVPTYNYAVTGGTNSLPYHTGVNAAARNTSNKGAVQYRYIEDLWGNCLSYISGIFTDTSNNIYCTKKTTYLHQTSTYNYTKIGNNTSSLSGFCITSWTNPSISGYEWALIPATANVTDFDTYVTDGSSLYNQYGYYNSLGVIGVNTNAGKDCGLFYIRSLNASDNNYLSSRLMVLPPSRLTT